jgi:hypothetical protein
MTAAQIFAPAQLVGYLALVLGISAFLQKKDQRLRLLNATQSLAYAVHFFLLGNAPATASAAVSSARSFTALRYRSPILAVLFVGIIVGLGAHYAHGLGWLTIIASSISTLAMFLLTGVPLRIVLFTSTLMWLTNNYLCGSIGGTVLEFFIGAANLTTIFRMLSDRTKAREEATLREPAL